MTSRHDPGPVRASARCPANSGSRLAAATLSPCRVDRRFRRSGIAVRTGSLTRTAHRAARHRRADLPQDADVIGDPVRGQHVVGMSVCWRNGNDTLPPTVIELNSAPSWNSTPNLSRRSRSGSASDMFATGPVRRWRKMLTAGPPLIDHGSVEDISQPVGWRLGASLIAQLDRAYPASYDPRRR